MSIGINDPAGRSDSSAPLIYPQEDFGTVGNDSNSRSTRVWTLVLTSVAFFMVALDALVVITALPAMQRDLRASMATLQWTVNAYGLTYAAGIITAAALGDRLGRRRVLA